MSTRFTSAECVAHLYASAVCNPDAYSNTPRDSDTAAQADSPPKAVNRRGIPRLLGPAARERESPFFSRSLLRCANFLPQNYATQRKAARISLAGISSGKHAAQHREKLRKPSSLNYKPAALNQLSYAGVPIRKLFQRVDQERFVVRTDEKRRSARMGRSGLKRRIDYGTA